MPSRRLIREGWYQYAKHVLPKNAPTVQKQETHRAFYAGAAYLWDAFTNAVWPADVSEDAGMDILQGVDDEIRAFLRDVERGRR